MSRENFQAFLENFSLPQTEVDKLWNGNIRSVTDLATAERSTILGLVNHPILNTVLPVLQRYSLEISSSNEPTKRALDLLRCHATVEESSFLNDTPGDDMPTVDEAPSTSCGRRRDIVHHGNVINANTSGGTMIQPNFGGTTTYNVFVTTAGSKQKTSSEVTDLCKCPACRDQLRKPVRILSCGHSFCHVCLEQICNSSQHEKLSFKLKVSIKSRKVNIRCPKCEETSELSRNEMENLPRNLSLESVMDELTKVKTTPQNENKEKRLTTADIKRLRATAIVDSKQSAPNNTIEKYKCPACHNTLRKPIRVLKCGDSLCHVCLKQLRSASQKETQLLKLKFATKFQKVKVWCPKCGESSQLSGIEMENIPRNLSLENAIDEITKVKTTPHREKEEKRLTPAALQQLHDSASMYQQQNNFQNAVKIFEIVIEHVEGWDKLEPSIHQAECLLCLKKKDPEKVEIACGSIVSIVDTNRSSRLTNQVRDSFDQSIDNFASKLAKVMNDNHATFLVRCRFQFAKNHYKREERLDKLYDIALSLETICESVPKQNKRDQFQEEYSLLEEILEFMESTGDVDLKMKCLKIACFLYRFGNFCYIVGDCYKAITKYECAITLFKTVAHAEAHQYSIFGYFHYDMGKALKLNRQFFAAKIAYTKASKIFNTAIDWSSKGHKLSKISLSITELKLVEQQIYLLNNR